MDCIDETRVADFVEGRLPASHVAAVMEHVDACEACRTLIALSTAALAEARSMGPPRDELSHGQQVTHYRTFGILGAGAMGIVYAATDLRLDRRVALKILRDSETEEDAGKVAERLVREGQAMAKLSHPNVVTVYEVGALGEHVFLAMEYVDGDNVGEWLRIQQRSCRQILEVFEQAGRGLAAVHASGWVVRDFKPENVLVGSDGRVRVTDFGLAKPATRDAPASTEPTANVTAVSSIAGTPAYMAPEQRRGKPADARSDQYSFAVALSEALIGARPESSQGQAAKIPSRGTAGRIPLRVRRALRRALSTEPEQRFESMDALLRQLRPGSRLAWALSAGAAVVAISLTIAGYEHSHHGPVVPPCGNSQERFAGVWDLSRKEAVRTAFLGTGESYAQDTWEKIERSLDAYEQRWVAMHQETCEATRVRGEQSEALLDERMECLDRRRVEVRKLVEIFTRADSTSVTRAVSAVDDLSRVDDCSSARSLRRMRLHPTKDPSVRGSLVQMEETQAQLKALQSAGKYDEALAVARSALDATRVLHDSRLEATLLAWEGRMSGKLDQLGDAERALLEAAAAAEASGDDDLAARAWTDLLYYAGYRAGKLDAAERYDHQARLSIQRLGDDNDVEGWHLYYLGAVRILAGRLDDALSLFSRAQDWCLTREGSESLVVLAKEGSAVVNQDLGRLGEAIRLENAVLSDEQARLGDSHPNVTRGLLDLGGMLLERGEYSDALEILTRGLDRLHESREPQPLIEFRMLEARGIVLVKQDSVTLALQDMHDALRVAQSAKLETLPEYVVLLSDVGETEREAGHLSAAVQLAAQAIRLANDDHPLFAANAHSAYSETLLRARNAAQAVAEARHAVQIFDFLPRAQPPFTVAALARLGLALAATGEQGEAIHVFERALVTGQSFDGDPFDVADTEMALAQTLWDSHGDLERARELATSARDTYARDTHLERKRLAAQRFLDSHPSPR